MLNGKGLKKLRTYKGYHQKEIADSLKVCQQYISKLESKKKGINEFQFKQVLKAMDINNEEWEKIKYLFPPTQNNEE